MCDYYGCDRSNRGGKVIRDYTGEVWARYCSIHAPNNFEEIFHYRSCEMRERLFKEELL